MSEPSSRASESELKGLSSSKTSPAVSCHELDVEKADGPFDDDSLARYVVPVLEKGVKTALAAPPSYFTRFRVWYNPYRQVSCAQDVSRYPTG